MRFTFWAEYLHLQTPRRAEAPDSSHISPLRAGAGKIHGNSEQFLWGKNFSRKFFLGEMNFESTLCIYSHPLTYRRRGGLPAPGPRPVTEVTVGHGGELPRGLVVVVSEVGAAAPVQPLLGEQLLHPRRGPRQPQHPVQPQQPAQPHKQGVPPPVQPNPDRRNYK